MAYGLHVCQTSKPDHFTAYFHPERLRDRDVMIATLHSMKEHIVAQRMSREGSSSRVVSEQMIASQQSEKETYSLKQRIEDLEASLSTLQTQLAQCQADLESKDQTLSRQSVTFSPDLSKFTSIAVCENALLALDQAKVQIIEKKVRLAIDEELLCVICMDAKRDTVLIPCGHGQFCWDCVSRLPNKRCPCCTSIFRNKMKLYFK
jgi:hypothetical protein